MNHIIKSALTLCIVAAVVVALLGFVRQITEEPISENRRRIEEAAKQEVLPRANAFTRDDTAVLTGNMVKVFLGWENGQFAGYVIELSPEGYSGNIDMLVGVCAMDKKISGMRIMRHTETPGLGSLAASEAFYRKFDDRPLRPITVVKGVPDEDEIDALASATITTKAITNAVNEAVEWVLNQ